MVTASARPMTSACHASRATTTSTSVSSSQQDVDDPCERVAGIAPSSLYGSSCRFQSGPRAGVERAPVGRASRSTSTVNRAVPARRQRLAADLARSSQPAVSSAVQHRLNPHGLPRRRSRRRPRRYRRLDPPDGRGLVRALRPHEGGEAIDTEAERQGHAFARGHAGMPFATGLCIRADSCRSPWRECIENPGLLAVTVSEVGRGRLASPCRDAVSFLGDGLPPRPSRARRDCRRAVRRRAAARRRDGAARPRRWRLCGQRGRADARRRGAARRCVAAWRHRPLPHAGLSHALRQDADRPGGAREEGGRPRLRGGRAGRARPLCLRWRVPRLHAGRQRRLRHDRVGRGAALVHRPGRHVRPLVSRRRAMARRRAVAPASRGDGAGDDLRVTDPLLVHRRRVGRIVARVGVDQHGARPAAPPRPARSADARRPPGRRGPRTARPCASSSRASTCRC